MASRNYGAADRFASRVYENKCERLCAYLKNDSLIRREGFTQQQIDDARARLAKHQFIGTRTGYLGPNVARSSVDEERQRRWRAEEADRRYLRALEKAGLTL